GRWCSPPPRSAVGTGVPASAPLRPSSSASAAQPIPPPSHPRNSRRPCDTSSVNGGTLFTAVSRTFHPARAFSGRGSSLESRLQPVLLGPDRLKPGLQQGRRARHLPDGTFS